MSTHRQQEIIDVSLEIISTMGIQALTIKNLSKKIGISEPAIYRHFENKISILIAILDFFKTNGEIMFSKLSQSTESPMKKIENIFQGYFEIFQQKPSLISVISSEEIFRNEPILQKKIYDIMNKNIEVVNALVDEGQAKGEIKTEIESKYLTLIIIGSLRMLIKRWQMGDKTFNHREEVNNFFNTIKSLISK